MHLQKPEITGQLSIQNLKRDRCLEGDQNLSFCLIWAEAAWCGINPRNLEPELLMNFFL